MVIVLARYSFEFGPYTGMYIIVIFKFITLLSCGISENVVHTPVCVVSVALCTYSVSCGISIKFSHVLACI